MTTPHSPKSAAVEDRWRAVLSPGPACLPTDRLGHALTEDERAHVAGCARCQTELDLLAAYDADGGDGAGAQDPLAVQLIAAKARRAVAEEHRARVRRRADATSTAGLLRGWRMPAWALTAASLALVAGGAALLWSPGRGVDPQVSSNAPVYRTARIDGLAPSGDLDRAPTAFSWAAVPGAADYDVRLTEVDGTELWHVTTTTPAVQLPAAVQALARPAKTLVWQVSARDRQRAAFAESGATSFRVRVAPDAPPPRD